MRLAQLKLWTVVGAACWCLQALAGGSPPPDLRVNAEGADKPPFELADQARVENGKRRFDSTCAAFCHGHAPPLFMGRQGLAPEQAFRTIRDGGGTATPMPPWGEIFSSEEIWELVAYIKYLGSQKPQ